MKNVLIVGAGIAGCCAAISLGQAGWNVTVIEKQSRWAFQSSGIFVYSNGLLQFEAVGVMDDLLDVGFAVPGGCNAYYDERGRHLITTRYPALGGAPAILGIKRAEIHRILSARLDRLGIPVRLGTTVTSLSPSEESVEVTDSAGGRQRFDLVIGADGIRSGVRALLWPEVQPTYSGFGVWRSVHRRPPELVEKVMQMAPGKRLGIMPIGPDRLYLFGTVPEPARARYEPADWPRIMRERFAQFEGPVRPFLDQLESGDAEVLYTAVEEVVLPLPWHRGRVVLIGDAAHASTPFMGQGGAMAVHDAVSLGRLLAADRPVEAVLAEWADARAPMCRFVQDVSRRVGESGAQVEAHSRNIERLLAEGQGAVDGFFAELARLDPVSGARE